MRQTINYSLAPVFLLATLTLSSTAFGNEAAWKAADELRWDEVEKLLESGNPPVDLGFRPTLFAKTLSRLIEKHGPVRAKELAKKLKEDSSLNPFRKRKPSKESVPDENSNRPEPPRPATPPTTFVRSPSATFAVPFKMKAPYLSGEQGEKVTLKRSLGNNVFIAECEDREGMIFANALCSNVYSSNADRVACILISRPELLTKILEKYPDRRAGVTLLLKTQGLLPQALKILFALELQEAAQHGSETALFRQQTAAAILAAEIFAESEDLLAFRRDFVRFAMKSINSNYLEGNPASLAIVIEECVGYLWSLRDEQIPNELRVLLSTLLEAINERHVTSLQTPVLLGTLFFLKFISPTLVQPHEFGIYPSCSVKDLILLSKAIQLISNQTLEPNNDFFDTIRSRLIKLHDPVAKMLMRIATLAREPLFVGTTNNEVARVVYELVLSLDNDAHDLELTELSELGSEVAIVSNIISISRVFGLAALN